MKKRSIIECCILGVLILVLIDTFVIKHTVTSKKITAPYHSKGDSVFVSDGNASDTIIVKEKIDTLIKGAFQSSNVFLNNDTITVNGGTTTISTAPETP